MAPICYEVLSSLFFFNLVNNKIKNLNKKNQNFKNLIRLNCQQPKIKVMGKKSLNPYWVTGFTDAEGCFTIILSKRCNNSWKVIPSFEISLHIKDLNILKKLQKFFGVGSIYLRTDKKIGVYRVSALNDLILIISNHFFNYSLITKKKADFLLWYNVLKLIQSKEHLNPTGLNQIVNIVASINRGISKNMVKNFSNIKPVNKPLVKLPLSLNSFWISGFVDGDGGFSVVIRKSKSHILGKQINYSFHITQHCRDKNLLELFISFFNCGFVHTRQNLSRSDFIVQDYNNITNKILPHFSSFPLETIKQLDFQDFCKIMFIIKEEKHLSLYGLKEIKNLLSNMNTNRKLNI